MEKQLELLAELQDLDIQIDQLRKNVTEKPLKIEKLEVEFNIFEQASKDEAAKLDKLEKEKRSYEVDLKEGEVRIGKSKENLMHMWSTQQYVMNCCLKGFKIRLRCSKTFSGLFHFRRRDQIHGICNFHDVLYTLYSRADFSHICHK